MDRRGRPALRAGSGVGSRAPGTQGRTFPGAHRCVFEFRRTPNAVTATQVAASLVVMPILSRAQRRTGLALGSSSGVADSLQTLLCTYLSAVLLAGVVLNATLGWSWADPAAGLVIAAVAVREAREAWNGEGCGCLPESTTQYADDSATGQAGEHCDDACCDRSQVAVSGADR